MPYLESTENEFLEIVCESVFSDRKKKTVDDLLAKARKTLKRKLKTVADCDDYMAAIKSESTKFNECLKSLQVAKKKYDAGKIVPKDFDETVKAATMLLNKNCKQLQAKLGNFVDDKRAITAEEIAAFNAYVKGLGEIVKEIMKERRASAAKEAAYDEMEFDPEMDFAFEGADDSDDKDDEDEDKDDKKKSKKSKKDDDDDDEDDAEDEDEDDDKKSKSKSKDKEDDAEDDDEDDDDKSKKSKKDDKDDFDFDDSDFDFGDDDDKDEKDKDDKDDEDEDKDAKKKSKKSKKDDDDEDDAEDEDEDDDKKSKPKSKDKEAKESVFGDIFDFDD